jgi:chromatin remodeling complex protein RSC6
LKVRTIVNIICKNVKVPSKKEKIPGSTPSQFEKPMRIGQDIAIFAEWDIESLHSRVDITKVICNYICTNNLQNPENRRIIMLDEKLKTLLGVDVDTITYPDIQKYIGAHLIKDVCATVLVCDKPKKERKSKKPKIELETEPETIL